MRLQDDDRRLPVPARRPTHEALAEFPNITAVVQQITNDDTSVVGSGCNDQLELEFALDLMLDGLERLREAGAGGP